MFDRKMQCELWATVLLLLSLLLFPGCWKEDGNVADDVFGGELIYDNVVAANEAKVFFIDSSNPDLIWGDSSVVDYPIIEGPLEIEPELIPEIAGSITAANTYVWGSEKACGNPTPGVRIRFTKNGQHVDVLFCFKCNILGAFVDGKLVGSEDGLEDFDNGRPEIVRFMQQVFPDNPLIQGLPKTGIGLGPRDK